jgi:spermidine synthase/predicted MFS family arabinose efflux permease
MPRIFRLAPLLFFSGACSLVYQSAWLREFRLIFGASTLASAAVTAIFMGGLGLGSWFGGRWVDRHKGPLMLYGNLELIVAASSALTPLLVPVVRAIYVGVGGSLVLGEAGASVVRLVLSAVVLAIPTLGMGATLPAVVAAAVNAGGEERQPVGWLYGANTLGAVCGTLLGTFVLIEIYGIRQTLWMAALVNILVGLVGRVLSRSWPGERVAPSPEPFAREVVSARGQRILVVAAAVVGLVFFLMEMVWYRLLGPVLGGSTFTFGLILALALLGIAIGGALHSLLAPEGGGSPSTLVITCLLEAFFLALPFVFADDLAVLAALLRSLATFGLMGLAFGWSIVAGVVIVPAAIVAGYQFPLLISLLRPRTPGIGSAVALGYAANTAGSIAGALLGGFGLLRLLSAPGAWRLAVLLLVVLAIAVVLLAGERRLATRWRGVAFSSALAICLCAMMLAPGPSAVWRHSAIGAGRADLLNKPANELQRWKLAHKGDLLWETDGVESSVALTKPDDLAFVVNGKVDGSAVGDSGTQVMSGLLAAMSHPGPHRSLVIGLGTGSTAGWLAAVPEMERVDVIEIEPAIVEVARRAAPVNQNVLANPKVHLFFRDAREVLLASSEKYDLIFSEPSNPYRVGVASLFSNEFYRAVRARLNPGGVFLQWVQGYEIFPETLRTAMATLSSAFPSVETWQTRPDDLVFAASEQPRVYDVARLKARAAAEPFRTAMLRAWRVEGVEGYLAYFVGAPALVKAVALEEGGDINTDDHPILEFGFARSVGRSHRLTIQAIRDSARSIHADRPAVVGDVDWDRVEQIRMEVKSLWGGSWRLPPSASEETRGLYRLLSAWRAKNFADARRQLQPMLATLRGPIQASVAAEVLLHTHDPELKDVLPRLAEYEPLLARVLTARTTFDSGDTASAATALEGILRELRTGSPWAVEQVLAFSGPLALRIARKEPARTPALVRLYEDPFPVFRAESLRRRVLADLAEIDPGVCLKAYAPFEPFPAWDEKLLALRLRCYEQEKSPLVATAREDLARYRALEGGDFRLRGAPAEVPETAGAAGREEKLQGEPSVSARAATAPAEAEPAPPLAEPAGGKVEPPGPGTPPSAAARR